MKFLPVLFLALAATPSFASSLTCTLTSGKQSQAVTVDLTKIPDDYPSSESVYDLSFILDSRCENARCSAEITLLSQKLEDEAGSTSFEFASDKKGVAFAEAVTGAPDKRAYRLSCEVR